MHQTLTCIQLLPKMLQASYLELRIQLLAKLEFISGTALFYSSGSMELMSGQYRQNHILCHFTQQLMMMVKIPLSGMMGDTFMIISLHHKTPQNLRKLQLLAKNKASQTKLQLYLTSMEQLLSLEMALSMPLLSLLNPTSFKLTLE
jgi:hypothetical protein